MKRARWSRDHSSIHSGNLCRDDVHYDRRGIGGRASRNIHTGTFDGHNALAETHSIWTFNLPRLLAFMLMESTHSADGLANCLEYAGIYARSRPKQIFFVHP